MNKGYSKKIKRQLLEDEMTKGPGVELGELCIKHNYSVYEVAEVLGVSRATVYNWFRGAQPSKHIMPKIQRVIDHLRKKEPPTDKVS